MIRPLFYWFIWSLYPYSRWSLYPYHCTPIIELFTFTIHVDYSPIFVIFVACLCAASHRLARPAHRRCNAWSAGQEIEWKATKQRHWIILAAMSPKTLKNVRVLASKIWHIWVIKKMMVSRADGGHCSDGDANNIWLVVRRERLGAKGIDISFEMGNQGATRSDVTER